MSDSGSAKTSSSVGSSASGPSVCSDVEFLIASGGLGGSIGPRHPDNGEPVFWDGDFHPAFEGNSITVTINVSCEAGVLTVFAEASGSIVYLYCGSQPQPGTVTILSHNPVLFTVDFPPCLDGFVPGTVTVSE